MNVPASATSLPSESRIANDRSRAYVNDQKSAPAAAERIEAVVEDVLRDGDVQRPEEYRPEQHQVDRAQADGTAHHSTVSIGCAWMDREPTRDDVDALVGPA